MKVRLFGTHHGADESVVEDELRSFVNGSEPIFYEFTRAEGGLKTSFLKNPAVVIGMEIYLTYLSFIQHFRSNPDDGLEKSVCDTVSEETGQETYPIGLDIAERISQAHVFSTISSWIVILFWISLAITSGLIFLQRSIMGLLGVLMLVAIPFFSFCLFIKVVNDERESVMYSQTADVADSQGYETVCWVVGHEHVDGLRDIAELNGHTVVDE